MNLNISRLGEPKLLPGSSAYESESVQARKAYEIETTRLPAWPRGDNWCHLFNKQLSGGDRFQAAHDGVNKIVAQCWAHDEPHLIEAVDAAIEKANEEEGTIQYAGNV